MPRVNRPSPRGETFVTVFIGHTSLVKWNVICVGDSVCLCELDDTVTLSTGSRFFLAFMPSSSCVFRLKNDVLFCGTDTTWEETLTSIHLMKELELRYNKEHIFRVNNTLPCIPQAPWETELKCKRKKSGMNHNKKPHVNIS